MKPKPVWRAKVPAYPTRLQILADPAILERHVPPAWRATRDIASAVAVFLAANAAGCATGGKGSSGGTPLTAIVAPIFEHGEGRGSIGCIAVLPPEFLSEEEAMDVIAGELKKVGVDLCKRNVTFDEVRITRRYADAKQVKSLKSDLNDVEEEITKLKLLEHSKINDGDIKLLEALRNKIQELMRLLPEDTPLRVNAMDGKCKIAVKYVSQDNYYDCGGEYPNANKIIGLDYSMVEVAQYLMQQIRGKGRGVYMGVFYDPMTCYDEAVFAEYNKILEEWRTKDTNSNEEVPRLIHEYEKKLGKPTTNRSLEHLREQVKDFIDWLKAQGAI